MLTAYALRAHLVAIVTTTAAADAMETLGVCDELMAEAAFLGHVTRTSNSLHCPNIPYNILFTQHLHDSLINIKPIKVLMRVCLTDLISSYFPRAAYCKVGFIDEYNICSNSMTDWILVNCISLLHYSL